MAYVLPATTYQQPQPRLGRGRKLNTIVEDNEEMNDGSASESDEASDVTLTGKSAVMDKKCIIQPSQLGTRMQVRTATGRPPSVVSSEGDDDDDDEIVSRSGRSSCSESDAGTVFSDLCSTLSSGTSDCTLIESDSRRSSTSSRNSRNRYPALLIPRGAWQVLEGELKQMPLGMSPSTKIKLSSETLDRLPNHVPDLDATPSLGDASSIRSDSPRLQVVSSAPQTPEMNNIEVIDGQSWDGRQQQLTLNTALEIAIDEEHSILLSPQEAHSAAPFSAHRTSFTSLNEIMRQFPAIPGATPIDITPLTPNIPRNESFDLPVISPIVRLPTQALAMLQTFDSKRYLTSETESTVSGQEEMKECEVPCSRPRSLVEKSPVSEYSISQLSIPSPGGFFASLKAGTRHTWCSSRARNSSPPPPSSTTAENFYNAPWNRVPQIKETILECEYGDEEEDGLPTARQIMFDTYLCPSQEVQDLYDGGSRPTNAHEYDESYEVGLKQAAETNMNQTGSWLAAQTSYLAALRDTNPVNDPKDFSMTPNLNDHALERGDASEQESQAALRFLEEARAATGPRKVVAPPPKEPTFLEAFTHQRSETKKSDVFLHSSSRLESVETTRIATPENHVRSLLNTYTSKTLEPCHTRPKYRGPFGQNPRNSTMPASAEQSEFKSLEKEQIALNSIKPTLWSLEAQRTILYHGRLMVNGAASERITKKNTAVEAIPGEQPLKPKKKRPQVLDLAGAATASWAWAAATKWNNSKVYTVQTKQQAELAKQYPVRNDDDVEAYRPKTPKNHKVLSVPHLWQLPFSDNQFDLISARTLHMYLRAHPVPGFPEIDEWDMTLKECFRVLKPGGVLDFFVMDSGISNDVPPDLLTVNLSPSNMTTSNAFTSSVCKTKKKDIVGEFKLELERRGFEIDGGCGQLMRRLKEMGFVGVKRQWIGLPMGRAESTLAKNHHRNTSSGSATSHWINQHEPSGNSRRPFFRPAPRPISEVSLISKIVDQYAGVEAVQGPVGSTNDVSDMSALLGELLWEEWFVRTRIESGRYTAENILDGVDEQFAEWRRSGKAAWRGVIGWARKPTKKDACAANRGSLESDAAYISRSGLHHDHDFAVESPLPTAAMMPPALLPPMRSSARSSVRSSARFSADCSIRRRSAIAGRGKKKQSDSAGSGLSIDTRVTQRSAVADWARVANEVSLEDFTESALDRGEVGEIPMMMIE